ncbi:MAG: T9SS type A sorting domain-containing protein [Rhodothermales bacterium]
MSIQSACGADWELPISVKDAKKQTETLTIGQSSSASDAVNATCGEADTPPPPPPGIFGARFLLPDAKSYSAADYRSNGSQRVTWRIVLSGAHSFTFEWDPTALPAGDFWLKDTINGGYVSIDMATTTKYVLTDKTITELVIERYPDGPCIDLPVTAGWNLFSIPLEAYDMRPQALFSDKRARPYGFNAGYEAPAQLATGKGYWMQFKKAATYSICGIYADGGIDVAIGWNLVGPHNQSKPIGSIVKNPSTTVLSSYYGYDGTMFVTDSLKAGRGYWVNSNKVAVLTVGAGKTDADPFSRPFAVRAEDPEWTTLRLTTASGSTQTLFVSQRALSSDETFDYALPPKAPGDVFDARFASGLQVAALFAAPALIELSGVDYPLTLTAENLSDQALYVTDGSGQSAFYTAVQESRPATITEPMGLLRLTLGAEQVGTEDPTTFDTAFALHPGYPNPFSRTTTLKYQLPTSASVRLRVFNALGQIVATLEESIQAPGVYERTFDASALSAGFYYYTLEAGDYRAARTLVLVK